MKLFAAEAEPVRPELVEGRRAHRPQGVVRKPVRPEPVEGRRAHRSQGVVRQAHHERLLAQHERVLPCNWRLGVFLGPLVLALVACGTPDKSTPQTAPRVASFTATYGLSDGRVNGAPLVVTSATGTAGMAKLVYDEARGSADLTIGACVKQACSAPGGAVAVTAPSLALTAFAGRTMVFESLPGAPAAVTVTASGLQMGVPFDLEAVGFGKVPFHVFGVIYPFR